MNYADTSFLVSCYIQDVNTQRALPILRAVQEPFAFTPLHELEVQNAFRLAEFRQQISATEATAAWADVQSDLSAGLLVPAPLPWTRVFGNAMSLSAQHTSTTGSRSLDILHVSSAVALGLQTFYTFDFRQAQLAKNHALVTVPA